MSYGIEIRSEIDSSILVSDQTPAMMFAGKGGNTVPAATDSRNVTYRYTNTSPVIPTSIMPICFIASSSGVLTKTTFIQPIGGNQWSCLIYQNSSIAVDVYWFYNPTGQAASANSYGLRIYNPSSQLIFDAGWGKFCSIDQISSISNVNGATSSFSALTKPAFLHFNSWLQIIYTSTQQYWYFRYFKWAGTTITLTDALWFQGSFFGSGSWSGGSGGTIAMPIINASLYD